MNRDRKTIRDSKASSQIHRKSQNQAQRLSSFRKSSIDEELILDNFRLDAEVSEKLDKLRAKQKIAFLSTSGRKYYPEHPGHSKFALKFQSSQADPTLPAPEFYVNPFKDRLNKPISRMGYGMGGLSAPRFAKEHGEQVPSPNQYQKHVREMLTRQHRFPHQVWINYGLLGPGDKIWDDRVGRKLFTLWGKCHQINVAFGTSTKEPRFGKRPRWNCVGPGHYSFHSLTVPQPRVFNGFLKGPPVFNPATKLHCSYGPKKPCLECGVELMGQTDYYRTRLRVNPTPLRPIHQNTEEAILQAIHDETKRNKQVKEEKEKSVRKGSRLLLCRLCYCKALRGESRYWKTRADVERLFEKTRHCGFIHQHNGLADYTMKASCYWTRRLIRKEAVLSRHYPDKCEKRIIERKQKYQA